MVGILRNLIMPSESRGYLTLAFGKERFLEMAVNLARSLALHDPGTARAIVTDQPEHPLLIKWFQKCIPLDPSRGIANHQKAYLYDYSPYEETLVIDSDCLVLRSADPLWEKLAVQDFSVIGSNLQEGAWRYDIAKMCERLGVETIPKFNGGCYFFRKSPVAENVARKFQAYARDYRSTLILTGNDPRENLNVSEELCLSLVLAELSIPAVEGYEHRELIGPIQFQAGSVVFEILYGIFECRTEEAKYQSYVGHFFWNWHLGFHYRRECYKMKLALEYRWPRWLSKMLINLLWNPPYFIFTLLYGLAQRITDRRPIRIMACERPDAFFKAAFRK